MYIVLTGLDCALVVSTIVNSLQTGLLTSELVWYCRYSWTNLYCNEWLRVLMSRDVNDSISWHPGCDVISGDIQRCRYSELQFWSVKFTGRIVFCQVIRICKLKSIYTMDKLYRWTFRSLLEVHIIIGCYEYELCSKIFRPFVTDQDYFEFISSHLKFDSERSIGRAAVVILLVNLFVIKVRSELRGCGHTGHWW